jgi:hypothetical protein
MRLEQPLQPLARVVISRTHFECKILRNKLQMRNNSFILHFLILWNPKSYDTCHTERSQCSVNCRVAMVTVYRAVEQISRAYDNGWPREHYRRSLRLLWQHEEKRLLRSVLFFNSTQTVLYMQTKLLQSCSQLKPETIQFTLSNAVQVSTVVQLATSCLPSET